MNDAVQPSPPTRWWSDAGRGIVQTLPVLPAYSAIAIAFGVLAVDNGIAPWLTIMMSALVFAGTAQLAAVPMIALGLPPVAILATAAVTCARFLAMSAALAPYLRHLAWWERLFYGAHIASANFAIHVTQLPLRHVPKAELFAANLTGYVIWVAATAVGAIAGQSAGDLDRFGIDFAMPAMFVALLVGAIRNRGQAAAAVFGGIATIVLLAAGASHWTILLAASAGCAAGWSLHTWTKRRSS
ncbi:MAG: AzlC family ABC transporter permease [Alphaproteobacteria bacterium]|nr:AzlC family ABC transporter permease [Alphaproteobacteria bacterium]